MLLRNRFCHLKDLIQLLKHLFFLGFCFRVLPVPKLSEEATFFTHFYPAHGYKSRFWKLAKEGYSHWKKETLILDGVCKIINSLQYHQTSLLSEQRYS